MKPILVICGPSCSGKTHLERSLLTTFPDVFHKLQQMTTRRPRSNETFGNPYIFVEKETFDLFENNLIGRIGLGGEGKSQFKDKYGSIPDFKAGKVATVILAEEAIIDLKDFISARKDQFPVLCIGLDLESEDLSEQELIEHRRSRSFIERERSVLQHADVIFKVKPKEEDPTL